MKTTRRVIGGCLLFAAAVMMAAFGLARHGPTKGVTIAGPGSSEVHSAKAFPIVLPQGNSVIEGLTMQLITIRPTGFDPAAITRGPGRFLLAVDNKTGLTVVTLRITTDGGGPVREIRLAPAQHKWREKMILLPGKYSLTEADHPNWICRITIAP